MYYFIYTIYYLNHFENKPNKLGTLTLLSSLVCLRTGLLYPILYLIFCLTREGLSDCIAEIPVAFLILRFTFVTPTNVLRDGLR